MPNYVKLLTVKFKNEISHREIASFRGAVIGAMNDADVLFHDHLENDKFRYAYPLIQYKRINGCAAVVCIDEGTEAIGEFFASCNFDFNIGGRNVKMEIDFIKADRILVQPWDSEFEYRIVDWLPFNQENYRKFITLESVVERAAFLENLLVGNILSFAKGIDFFFDSEVVCKITDIEEPRADFYKGVKMMSFNVNFRTNVSLPTLIGLGKGASLGRGVIFLNRNRQ